MQISIVCWNLNLQVPPVCLYQTAELTLKLTNEDGVTLPNMSRTYNGTVPPQLFLFQKVLRVDSTYTLEVVASTLTQEVTKVIQFGELPIYTLHTLFFMTSTLKRLEVSIEFE